MLALLALGGVLALLAGGGALALLAEGEALAMLVEGEAPAPALLASVEVLAPLAGGEAPVVVGCALPRGRRPSGRGIGRSTLRGVRSGAPQQPQAGPVGWPSDVNGRLAAAPGPGAVSGSGSAATSPSAVRSGKPSRIQYSMPPIISRTE